MNANNLISVVIPAYNSERYISDTIKSVIAQTHKNWELFVVDDGSTDRTREIVKALADTDTRITLVCNDKNLGVSKTRNRGFEMACGSYVALLDSDDVWHSDKLEKQLEVANQTGCDIIYCSYAIIDENGQHLSEYIVPKKTTYNDMLKESTISCSTAMLSKRIADTERFSPEHYHEDYAYWLHLLKSGYTATASVEVLADYRVAKGSRSHDKLKSAKNRWHIYRKVEHLPLWRSVSAFCSYAIRGTIKYRRMHK